MNNKLTIQQFAQRISEQSGESVEICEAYMRMLFKTIESSLIAEGEASFEGLGVFKVDGSDDERTVMFTPADELARLTNAPFAMFEAEELNPDVSDSMLDDISTAAVSAQTDIETIRLEHADDTPAFNQDDRSQTEAEHYEEPEAQPIADMVVESTSEPQPTEIPQAKGVTQPEAEPTPAIEQERQAIPEQQKVAEPQPARNSLSAVSEISAEAAPAVKPVNAAGRPAEPGYDRDIENDEEEEQQGHSRMLMFIIGLTVGLAIGAVATFFYMSEFGKPSIDLHPSDIESPLE